jgi:hypothetical protein
MRSKARCEASSPNFGYLGGAPHGKTPLLFFVILLASLVPFRTSPQSLQVSESQNLEMCVEGFSECNWNELSTQQRQWVKQSTEDRNFEDCFNGSFECDATKLDAGQKLDVVRAKHDRDLQNCLDGYDDCKLKSPDGV